MELLAFVSGLASQGIYPSESELDDAEKENRQSNLDIFFDRVKKDLPGELVVIFRRYRFYNDLISVFIIIDSLLFCGILWFLNR